MREVVGVCVCAVGACDAGGCGVVEVGCICVVGVCVCVTVGFFFFRQRTESGIRLIFLGSKSCIGDSLNFVS